MIVVTVFNLLLMNFIIAIFADTYGTFDSRSTGLYLSEILKSRGELADNDSFGAFFASIPPINVIQIPFIPLSFCFREGMPNLIALNKFLLQIQYTIFMMFFFVVFLLISVVLIPAAWIIGIIDKVNNLQNMTSGTEKCMNLGIFVPFGIVILMFDTLVDLTYFWKNNFRDDLKKTIIVKEKSEITHMTIRNIIDICKRYSTSKIKSVHATTLIRSFRRRYRVNQNLQFLIFRQMIPVGGFKSQDE